MSQSTHFRCAEGRYSAFRLPPSAFTLVELLVVITIIGMLVGMLIPAVQAARERGRQIKCTNSQKNIALAMVNFESSRGPQGCFPGYANKLTYSYGGTTTVSWAVMLFPYLDRNDLYVAWTGGTATTGGTNSTYKNINFLTCPTDPPETNNANDTWLSYVCNTGKVAGSTTGTANMADGVCFDQTLTTPPNPIRVSLDYISSHDGTSTTLLLAESMISNPNTPSRVARWVDPTTPTIVNPANVGFNWYNVNKVTDKINSKHGGGCVVAFCDGHAQFLKDDVDTNTFIHLMTPWGAGCSTPPTGILDDY